MPRRVRRSATVLRRCISEFPGEVGPTLDGGVAAAPGSVAESSTIRCTGAPAVRSMRKQSSHKIQGGDGHFLSRLAQRVAVRHDQATPSGFGESNFPRKIVNTARVRLRIRLNESFRAGSYF